MRKVLLLVLSFSVLTSQLSCATIMNGGGLQKIGITSYPSGARVMVDDAERGRTPLFVDLLRRKAHTVRLTKDGYEPADRVLTCHVSGWVWGNIIFGGVIGLVVDFISGGLWRLEPNQMNVDLAETT